jgi:hypothetical protein
MGSVQNRRSAQNRRPPKLLLPHCSFRNAFIRDPLSVLEPESASNSDPGRMSYKDV